MMAEFLPHIPADFDRAIKLSRFAKCPFSQILPCCRRHQMSIHDQDIAATVHLEKLDRAPHHVGKRRLLEFLADSSVNGKPLAAKSQQSGCCQTMICSNSGQIADHAGICA